MIIVNKTHYIEVKPSEGMVITNGELYSETEICLGCNDNAENYYEITNEEYAEILKKMEEVADEAASLEID